MAFLIGRDSKEYRWVNDVIWWIMVITIKEKKEGRILSNADGELGTSWRTLSYKNWGTC